MSAWPGTGRLSRRLAAMLLGLLASGAALAGSIDVRVTNDKGEPVADAVVYVVSPTAPPVKGGAPYLVDQVDKTYVPHVIAVPAGAMVNFPNSDNIRHHVYSFSSTKKFEIPLYEGIPAKPVQLDKPGVVALGCNIHDWMSGYILVAPGPWFAVTDQHGFATIDQLPEGEIEAEVWHEALRGKPSRTRMKASTGSEVVFQIRQKKVFSAFRGAASRSSGYR